MHIEPALDRGAIDSLAEWREDFRIPTDAVTHLVDSQGRIAVRGNRLVAEAGGGPWLLGRSADGIVHCARMSEGRDDFHTLRSVGALLDSDEAMLATQAVALGRWHAMDRFCAGCGNPVETIQAGWATRCTECERIEYPRTDPAVIVLVLDDNDRVLLAHNTLWNNAMMSLPAGFVEAGESPRRTVMRELKEEVNVDVCDVEYLAAQPWPAPRSLMLGFKARTHTAEPTPDGVEIDHARFFSRSEYRQALISGDVLAPGRAAIAYSILTAWYGEELPS